MTAPTAPRRREDRIVVGLEGSSADRATLEYALAAAARRGAGLDVITVVPTGLVWAASTYALDTRTEDQQRADVDARIRRLVEEVRKEPQPGPGGGLAPVPVHVHVTAGHPAQALVEASGDAELLVVGRRRRNPVSRTLLGSVALHSVTHAACPVLIVPAVPAVPSARRRVVAGVDGSACAGDALVLAVEEAARLGADVEAVTAYAVVDYPLDLYDTGLPTPAQLRADAENTARQQADAALRRLLDEGPPGPHVLSAIDVLPVEGDAADVLVERSRDALLLVVGNRGHGRFREVLLGSVALHCALFAECPVMVVHSRRATDTAVLDAR